MKKLFVGRLAPSTSESSLRAAFAKYEPLTSVKIITDKFSGESRGFAFVEIEDNQMATDAIQALDGSSLDGSSIAVNEARPKPEGERSFRPRSGGGGGGGGRDSYGSGGGGRNDRRSSGGGGGGRRERY